jgi:hypothetical protein
MFILYKLRGIHTCAPTFTDFESRKRLLRGVFAVNKIKNLTSVEVLETIKETLLKGY